MSCHVARRAFIIAALIVLGVAWASAQSSGVQIKFGFLAANKQFEAGTYSFDLSSSGNVMLKSDAGGTPVEIPKVRVLGNRNVRRVELVFDRIGSKYFLAEVWLPGKGGFQVGSADADERETVNGPNVK